MKIKTIRKLLAAKFDEYVQSITDPAVQNMVKKGTIITGGSICSMLMNEKPNDFDLYFRDHDTALAVAQYYVTRFNEENKYDLKIDDKDGRIRVVTSTMHRGESATARDIAITDPGQIEDAYQETEKKAQEIEDDGKPKYRPVFISTNAITLSDKIQLICRFYGEPDVIHESYDFVHCTNYWTSWEEKLVLRQPALEAILAKELIYVGSKYPVCSIIRIRKFIQRGWQINAGQILKMVMQCNDLDLTNPAVLEDQLTGVDSMYFANMIRDLAEKDPTKINTAYLCEIINRIF